MTVRQITEEQKSQLLKVAPSIDRIIEYRPCRVTFPFREPNKNVEVIWLEPEIRCMVKYLELDDDGLMRHSRFGGIVER
jgi:ATP-dependent DNA ligase